MKTRERNLWRWLAQARKVYGGDLHMSRIENAVGSGAPDVTGTFRGRRFDIELKTCDRPKRAATPVRFVVQPSQRVWRRLEARAGGYPYLLLQIATERFLAPLAALDEVRPYGWWEEHGILCKTPEDVFTFIAAASATR